MPLTPEQLAELKRLRQMFAPLAEQARRDQQRAFNAEQSANKQVPGKAKGGLEKFLEDSKVKGRAYHGTHADFKTFKSGPRNRLVKGMWFTSSPESANFWAGNKEGSNVMPVHLALKNPANREDYDRMLDELPYDKKEHHHNAHRNLKSVGMTA